MSPFLLVLVGITVIAGILIASMTKMAYVGITSFLHQRIVTQMGPLILLVVAALPEFAIGFMAHLANLDDMVLGIIFGSNAATLALLAAIALVYGSVTTTVSSRKDIITLFLFVAVPIMLLFDGQLNRIEGLLLIALFFFFQAAKTSSQKNKLDLASVLQPKKKKRHGYIFSIPGIFIVAALLIYTLSYLNLNHSFNPFIIGFIGIGFVSVLPELLLERQQVKRGAAIATITTTVTSISITMGLVLGSLAVTKPITMSQSRSAYLYSILYTLVAFFLIWLFTRSKRRLDRHEGAILIGLYGLFLLTLFLLAH
jgi:cation:H+ antiporter